MRIQFLHIALIVLYFLVCGCNNSTPPISDQKAKTTKERTTKAEDVTSIKLLFVGDVMGHDAQIKSAFNEKDKTYNFSDCFKYLEPIVSKADIAVANLEVTLPGVPPYAGYPHFRSPDALAKGLKDAGFDLIVTANNHSNDAGKIGVDHTLEVLEEQQLLATGTFKHSKEREANYPLIVERKGMKIAFLNCTYDTNGMPDIPPTVVNRIDTIQLEKDILKAKHKKADVIVALIHWGKEYKLLPSTEQETIANWLVNKGVDAVVGSHPHVIQPLETKQAGVKGNTEEVLISYSLGNFISNQRKADTEGGLLVEIEFEKNPVKDKIKLKESSYSLLWRYIHKSKVAEGKQQYYTIPIAPFEVNGKEKMAMSNKEQNKMIAFATKFRKHLAENGNIKEKKYTYDQLFDKNFIGPD